MKTVLATLAATLAIILLAAAWPAQARPRGPGLGSTPDKDERARKEVRDTLRAIRSTVEQGTRARADWRVERARLLAEKHRADSTLAACQQQYGEQALAACRIQQADTDQAAADMRDGIIVALERYETELTPKAEAIKGQVTHLVRDPRTYRHLLVQTDRGGAESKLLKMLLMSLETIERLKGGITEAVTRAYLADLLEGVEALEKDIELLKDSSPELDRALEEWETTAPPGDSLAPLGYPPAELD